MNNFAVAGFVTSIASLFVPFFGLTSVAGLALSAVGRLQAHYEKGRKSLSVSGMIISIASIVLACAENVFIVLLLLGKITL